MVVGEGGNTTLFTGPEGVLVVDTQFAPLSGKLLDVIKKLSDQPIRWIVNTHSHGDHIGGNEALARAGRTRAGGNVVGDIGQAATATARIIAHENASNRMLMAQPPPPSAAMPTDTFFNARKDMLFNGEAIQMFHQPAAHTDGDLLIHFRRADVLSTGDLFTTVMYPFIDEAGGGTIDGYIKALNNIIAITVPSNVNEGGTLVIPGHGRLTDEQDVIEYRDMVTIVRDRILEYVKRGMTLEQVKAKKPTLDFDPRYGSDTGFWTTSMFVEVIYKQMLAANPPARTAKPAPAPRRGNK
jgi:cyclase